MRRLRDAAWMRNLVREHRLTVDDLVWPVFVQEGEGKKTPVETLPGVNRYSIDLLVKEIKEAYELGINAVALFPVVDPKKKSEKAEEAINPENLVCRAIKAIKKEVPEIGVICDVALDPYTTHGQDGLVEDGRVMNDPTNEILVEQARTLADAGCDVVAPSDMMDGRVGEIRKYLDANGHKYVKILSYAAKYASSFYGPFRDAVGSKQALGTADKRTYQMDPANIKEALREVALDIEEGADMVMVKPGMPYLDVLHAVSTTYNVPLFAYQVSGEYAMLKCADERGAINYEQAMIESLLAFKRAGATCVFTYAAKEMAELLR